MAFARHEEGGWKEIAGDFVVAGFGSFPAGWLDPDRWTPASHAVELARLGIAAIVEAGPAPANLRVLGQALADVGGIPTRVWSTVAYGIDEARDLVRDRIKALREAKANGGAATPLGRVDSDSDSRLRISGAVQMAQIALAAGAPFAIDWTMSDGSGKRHDGPAMVALGVAVGQSYAAAYAYARFLGARVDGSADPFSLDIVTGWPG